MEKSFVGKNRARVLGVVLVVAVLCLPMLFGFSKADSNSCDRLKIEFIYKDKKFVFIDEIIKPTNHDVAMDIFLTKVNQPQAKKMEIVDKSSLHGSSYEKALLKVFPLLKKKVDEVCKFIDKQPTNSHISFYPNDNPMFVVSEEKEGYLVDKENLYREIYIHIKRKQLQPLQVKPQILMPQITKQQNEKNISLNSAFETSYATSSENRKSNIALALKKINGTRLLPGEEFSFNTVVGRRTVANGFKEAKIISNGVYVPGVGGGVCQVSTTVYNAALRAGLEIKKASGHSLRPSYVPPSFDAMVNSGGADLSFINNTEAEVFIRAVPKNGKCLVAFYGKKLPYIIKTESVITKETPPLMEEITDTKNEYFEEGTEKGTKKIIANGQSSIKSEGYLIYKDFSGSIIKKEKIRSDSYSCIKGKLAIAG